jgi:thiazole synthase
MRFTSTLNRLGSGASGSYCEPKMELKESIAVHVNGDLRHVTVGTSLAEVLGELGLDPRKVAVERNLEIVRRGTFEEVVVKEGDRLEIVHFVGGG